MKVDLDARNPRNLRIAVIVQESAAGRGWGAGLARLSNWGRLISVLNAFTRASEEARLNLEQR